MPVPIVHQTEVKKKKKGEREREISLFAFEFIYYIDSKAIFPNILISYRVFN